MQKRTNPLELKVEAKDYMPAPLENKEDEQSAVHTDEQAAPAPAEQPTPVEEAAPAEQTAAEEPAPTPVEEPAPAEPVAAEQPAPVEPAPVEEPVRPTPVRPAPVRPAPVRPTPVRPSAEPAQPTAQAADVNDGDTKIAVRFRLAGDIKRRTVLVRLSTDALYLAQALYPEQKIGTVLENALLTRCFLQDRDAFDAMAREILKNGGKIKC
ncbi:MAG: hypothetical protein IJW97_03155 [Clostridia bacterium]|nr:hypothetical protein [Clostridia bacterium]